MRNAGELILWLRFEPAGCRALSSQMSGNLGLPCFSDLDFPIPVASMNKNNIGWLGIQRGAS
jgi:hypothetical protein